MRCAACSAPAICQRPRTSRAAAATEGLVVSEGYCASTEGLVVSHTACCQPHSRPCPSTAAAVCVQRAGCPCAALLSSQHAVRATRCSVVARSPLSKQSCSTCLVATYHRLALLPVACCRGECHGVCGQLTGGPVRCAPQGKRTTLYLACTAMP